MAEWLAAQMPGSKDGSVKVSLAFYWLTPVFGVLIYVGFGALTGRPFMAFAGSLLYYGGLTAISNVKYKVLKSPFNAHDFDNARNLYTYPEFYVSYVGWPIAISVIAVFLAAVGVSAYIEPPFAFYSALPFAYGWPFILLGWFVGLKLLGRIITVFFNEHTMARFGVTMDLNTDVARFGLFPTIFLYRLLLKAKIDKAALREQVHTTSLTQEKPADIIAVQGESYFDIERLFTLLPEKQKSIWPILRDLETDGVTTGQITVPCWGAYTMQTEFSFLSTLQNQLLGIDRINPYMRFAQKPVSTIAWDLKKHGYRTICIHPAKKEFFRRSDVMPNMGFDEFIGIEAFPDADLFGKYISDAALADKIDEITQAHYDANDQPLFIFVITIESHGPWANGRLAAHLDENALLAANPTGDREFSLYQQHMENLLTFYRRLSTDNPANASSSRQRIVAMYGDHMPALGTLFDAHNFTETSVDYLFWNSANSKGTPPTLGPIKVENFGEFILAEAGIDLTK